MQVARPSARLASGSETPPIAALIHEEAAPYVEPVDPVSLHAVNGDFQWTVNPSLGHRRTALSLNAPSPTAQATLVDSLS